MYVCIVCINEPKTNSMVCVYVWVCVCYVCTCAVSDPNADTRFNIDTYIVYITK